MAGRTLIVIALLPVLSLSGVNSAFISKCKSDDSKCIKESTQAVISSFANGLPEYNVETLDPISFKRIDASTPNLKLILTDITITGLKDCIVKKVKRDKTKNKILLKLLCSVQLEGQYEMDGQLLILPIKGKGPLHVTLRKIELSIEGDLLEIEKDGVIHWDFKNWKHTYDLKDKSDVIFENLFDGNEVLAQAAAEVISSNSNEVILEVGPTTIKTVVNEVAKNVNNFFHSIPATDLSID